MGSRVNFSLRTSLEQLLQVERGAVELEEEIAWSQSFEPSLPSKRVSNYVSRFQTVDKTLPERFELLSIKTRD
jgi:hypothetical protein